MLIEIIKFILFAFLIVLISKYILVTTLRKFGIEDKIIVTEISEDDYSTRKDEIEEIKMLIKKEEEI